jgi:hypothetical protein
MEQLGITPVEWATTQLEELKSFASTGLGGNFQRIGSGKANRHGFASAFPLEQSVGSSIR